LSFRVRHATPADARALAALGDQVAAEPEAWLPTEVWRSVSEERRYLRALGRHADAAAVVVEAQDEIVGRLSVARDAQPASRHVADVGLMVAPEWRRRGAGRALLEAAERWARDTGVRKLELHVFPHNDAAIALYEQAGYVREGYRRGHYRRGGQYFDAVLMALDLTET
jgi:L-phenylalanine/L-methionine N-acetyltransferase